MLLLEKCLVQSSPSLLRPASGLLLYIQSTQREWSTMAFMCRGTLGSTQRSSPPSASPKAPGSVVASWAEPPAAVSSSCPGFQHTILCCGSLDHTAAKQTNWWVKAAQPGNNSAADPETLDSLCPRCGNSWKVLEYMAASVAIKVHIWTMWQTMLSQMWHFETFYRL